ncbi:OmpA family protein [Burkholderia cepacia]|uniref:OmpA family protein n=1 Tax=Burkholderia cepacia TaxID=292 RepID=UPI0018C629CA|nr:OmpA family protein [Burkholderia cepacia]
MGYPSMTGLQQVRDQRTGTEYFVPCNPCATPTAKTPVLGGYGQPVTNHALPASAPAAGFEAASREPLTYATLAAPISPSVQSASPSSTSKAARSPAALPAATIGTTNVRFASAAVSLSSEAHQALASLASRAAAARLVYVRGRTDASGSAAGNRAIAQARAVAVQRALIGAGVPASKLRVLSCSTCYVASNGSEAGRAANRRVEIEILN